MFWFTNRLCFARLNGFFLNLLWQQEFWKAIRPKRLPAGTLVYLQGFCKTSTTCANQLWDPVRSSLSTSKLKVPMASIERPMTSQGLKVVTCDFSGPSSLVKQARGSMCRYIVTKRIKDPAGLKKFSGFMARKTDIRFSRQRQAVECDMRLIYHCMRISKWSSVSSSTSRLERW